MRSTLKTLAQMTADQLDPTFEGRQLHLRAPALPPSTVLQRLRHRLVGQIEFPPSNVP